jgi:hypothetical protein
MPLPDGLGAMVMPLPLMTKECREMMSQVTPAHGQNAERNGHQNGHQRSSKGARIRTVGKGLGTLNALAPYAV